MKKAIFLLFLIVIGGAIIFVTYDMLLKESNNMTQSEIVVTETISNEPLSNAVSGAPNTDEKLLSYQNDFIAFEYPNNNLTLTETPDEASFLSLSSNNRQEPFLLKAYLIETDEKTADAYFNSLERAEFGATDFPERSFDFTYRQETYNNLPVMIHNRDFGGMLGEVNELYVWIGNGKVVQFYAEPNHPALDIIYTSVRRP